MKPNKLALITATILLLTGLQMQGQEYPEFAPKGAEWYYTYTYGCCPEKHFNHFISEKDTTVEGNDCRILRQYFDTSITAGEKHIIKQEAGKVYYYYQDRFNLLFDFDTKEGDTVEFTFMYKKYDDNSPSYKDTVLSARYRVQSITVDAQNLKTFTTKIFDEDKLANYGIEILPWYYSYTEKIGLQEILGSPLNCGFIPVLDNVPHPTVEYYRRLRCYSEADFSFVSDEWAATSLPCDYSISMGISVPKNENSIIYPNPFNDYIFVFANNGGSLEIIDVSGKVIYYSRLSNGINKISTISFLKGIYFIKIQNKNNGTQIFKTVKS
jgi:hypothetical protein